MIKKLLQKSNINLIDIPAIGFEIEGHLGMSTVFHPFADSRSYFYFDGHNGIPDAIGICLPPAVLALVSTFIGTWICHHKDARTNIRSAAFVPSLLCITQQ